MLIPFRSLCDFDLNQNISTIQSEIFNLHFDIAKQLIQQEKKVHPKNAAVIACENNLDFMTAFLYEQDNDVNNLKERSSQRLDLLEQEDESSPYYLHMQGEIIFQRAVIKALKSEMFSAALDARKAYKLFEENHEKFPQFKPSLKGLGLLHIMIGSIPENYKWIVSLAGLSGTIKQGMSELADLVNESVKNKEQTYLKNETLLILIYIEVHYGKDIPYALELSKLYDANYTSPLITFSIANIYAMAGKNDSVLETIISRKPDKDAYPLNYLDYMIGTAKLNKLDKDASIHFLKFINDYKGKRFVKSAYQKVAWMGLIYDDTVTYNNYISKLKNVSNVFTDEDKQAQTEAESGIKPNVHLLKARLLFDGGYYLKSLQLLAGTPQSEFISQKEKIEYIYRTARNFDLLNQKDKAITFYNSTISLGEKTTYYFAANSALNIAQIYEMQKDKNNAIAYYKKCLSMRNHEYQNSIDQKAKAGLNRLGAD
ncbi:MAG: hypothetical protein ABI723_12400 [Bacteroidia bacterium]